MRKLIVCTAVRALRNVELFKYEHFRQAALAIAIGIIIQIIVQIPVRPVSPAHSNDYLIDIIDYRSEVYDLAPVLGGRPGGSHLG